MARPVKNNADYHSHDSNMRNDLKIKALRRKFKNEGYAIYNMMLEVLTDSEYFEYEWNDFNIEILSGDFDIEPQLLKEIIDYCVNTLSLFAVDNGKIFSYRHQERFNGLLSKRKRDTSRVIASDNTQSKVKERKEKESRVENNTPAPVLGIDYIKAYNDLPDEFKNMYDEEFYKSWLNINSFISQHCQYLRKWSDQLTIIQFKNIFDRIVKKQIEIKQVQQAFLDLDGNRLAKEKYNSVYHGFNAYLKTIQKSA